MPTTIRRKMVQACSSVLILGLLVYSFAPARVWAASYITLVSFSGTPTAVQVEGGGWSPGETVSIYLNSVGGAPATTVTAGPDSFFGPIAVPISPGTPQGALPIIAVGSVNTAPQSNSFYVVPFSGSITVTGNNTPGSYIAIMGEGFAPNELIRFTFGGDELSQITANAQGGFGTGKIVVPNVSPGTYQIHAIGQASHTDAVQYFYVAGFWPSLTPSTYYLLPTQVLQFSGSGFATGETVQIFEGQNQAPLASFAADGNGNFTDAGAVTIPVGFSGARTFRAVGQISHASTQVEITVGQFNPNVWPSAYYILPGGGLTFSGGGFAVGESVKVLFNQTELATLTADGEGSFTNAGAVTIPFDWMNSSRTFHLVGQTSGASGDVTISVGQFNSLVSPSSYHIMAGEQIIFSGTDFAAGEIVNVTAGQDSTVLATFTADGEGNFTDAGAVTIPFAWANSNRTFHLTGVNSQTRADAIIIIAEFLPQVVPSSYYLSPGSKIHFSGTGFGKSETVVVTQGQNNQPLASIAANNVGGFTDAGEFSLPFNWAGKQTLHFRGESSQAATDVEISIAAFSPLISPSTYYVSPGQPVTISGEGFAANENVNITMNNGQPHTVMTTSSGGFVEAGPFTAPLSGNSVRFVATGEKSGVSASTEISLASLYPSVTPDKWYLPSGSSVIFAGTGFAPNENVAIRSAGALLATAAANAQGEFSNQAIATGFGGDRQITYTFTGADSGAVTPVTITVASLQPFISLDNYYAAPGTTIQVTGVGFAPNETVQITLGSANTSATADANGSVMAPITIPFGGGQNMTITATGQASQATGSTALSLASFLLDVSPSTWYTPAGSGVTFIGSGFAAGETVQITLNNASVSSTTVGPLGTFTTPPITIPFGAGAANFTFRGDQSQTMVSISITIAALSSSVQLSTYYAVGGTPLIVSGMGFASNEPVDVTFAGQNIGSAQADTNGNFALPTTVPYLTAGDKSVQAKGRNSGATAATTFTQPTMYVSAQLGSYAGATGTAVTFIGGGYLPNEPIEIITNRTGGTVVHSFSSDAAGNFNNAGYVLAADFAPGPLTFTIKGQHSLTPIDIVYYVTGG